MAQGLSIGQRLSAGFAIVITLAMGIAVTSIYQTQHMATVVEESARTDTEVAMAAEWLGHVRVNLVRTQMLIKAGNAPELKAELQPLMKATSARVTEMQKAIEAEPMPPDARALFNAVGQARQAYVSERDRVFKAIDAGEASAAQDGDKRLQPLVTAYVDSISALSTSLAKHAGAQQAEARALATNARNTEVGMGLLALLVGVIVAWRITGTVTSPLKALSENAERIASGDLSQPVHADRGDELGELQRALEHMRSSLANVVGSIRQSTDGITTASSEIAAGSQDLSGRTEQTASNLQQTASSMSELSTTVQATADSATTANQLAATAAETARRGGEVVGEVVGNMREISDSSRKIADIIGVIDGIAFQTNILALNAAVEAARAGEQGRGFAVVAGEVRSLAGRSAEAAREIKSLIGASVEKVESGVRLVESAGTTMADIVGSVQRVSDIIGEITAATAEQSSGITLINGTVNQLDGMTQQNAALVEQSAAAAESLKHQASRLAEVVQRFRLDGTHASVSGPAHAAATPVPYKPAPPPVAKASPAHPAMSPPAPMSAAAPQPVASHATSGASDGDWETF